MLDARDGDPDLEQACEDEGGQSDDEGWIEPDCGFDEDDPSDLSRFVWPRPTVWEIPGVSIPEIDVRRIPLGGLA